LILNWIRREKFFLKPSSSSEVEAKGKNCREVALVALLN
jgi:hypothetical protein